MHSPATRLFHKLLGLGIVYVVLQILVGLEVAAVIVALHLGADMSVPGAIATAMPVGLPLLLTQGAGYLLWRSMQSAAEAEQPSVA